MLVFERKDGHISCAMQGSVSEIANDLIVCIGSVHDGIKKQDPEAAGAVREMVEAFCGKDSELTDALFNHFDDPEIMNKTLSKKVDEKKKEFLGNLDDAIKSILRKLDELMEDESNA